MYGMNPLTLFIIPALFAKHPEDLPRFRDCKIERKDNYLSIAVLSRTGLPIRDNYDVSIYTEHPDFVEIREVLSTDEFVDDTYAYYIFRFPEKFRKDLAYTLASEPNKTSDEFKKLIYGVWPKIKPQISVMFETA